MHVLASVHRHGFTLGPAGSLPDWELTRGATVVVTPRADTELRASSLPLDDRNLLVVGEEEDEVVALDAKQPVFVAGGVLAYVLMMKHTSRVSLRLLEGEGAPGSTSFPMYALQSFRLVAESGDVLTYERSGPGSSPETAYINLIKDILEHGEERADRTGTGTLAVFGRQLRFDVSTHIPLLTTRSVPWRLVTDELLWFLRGDTDTKKLSSRIWEANTSREFLDARGLRHYAVGDIGSMYGFVWRHYGAEYRGCNASYEGQGFDQLAEVVRLLREDPFSRRIILTTYDVRALDGGVLHPCHGLVLQFHVDSARKRLSCHMYQRSMDVYLGGAWNIASYTMLLHLLARKADLVPHELIISIGDAHLYKDHLPQARKLIQRHPLPPPRLELSSAARDKPFEDLTVDDDFKVVGYVHHGPLPARMSA